VQNVLDINKRLLTKLIFQTSAHTAWQHALVAIWECTRRGLVIAPLDRALPFS